MINIETSKDKLEARISIQLAPDSFPTESEIKNKLKSEKIVFGIDDDAIHEICNEKNAVTDLVIAKGIAPEPGKDAELIWAIEINYSPKPAITETNRADFKQLKLIERIKKNQLLVSKLPPSGGVSGKNVHGEEITATGKDIHFPAGKNTWIAEDGLTMYSSIDGFAFWNKDLLHIDNIYQIKGNVDYHTGNISANGTVVIEGDVRSGFRVEATGSIIVGGNVEAASIYSQNGDISIQCGILGNGRAKILSGGNLTCGFIQDARVSVKKDIEVKHYVINSTLTAGGSISLIENEGLIRGGNISSGKGITAVEVGSLQKIYTELNVRLHSQDEDISNYWDIGRKQQELKKNLDSLQRRAAFIHLLQERVEDLSDEKKEELKSINKEISEYQKKIDDLQMKEVQIKKHVSTKAYQSEIKILDKLHSNVKIDIGDLEYFSQQLLQHVRIYCLDNEIVMEQLSQTDNAF